MAQQGEELRWWPRVKLAWPYASWAATTLFLIGAIAGLALAWRMGTRSVIGFTFSVADPAAAALLLIVLALIIPDLYAPQRLTRVHVFALPTLFTMGVLLFRFLVVASSPIGLVMAFTNTPRPDRIWSNMGFLALLWVVQVVILFGYLAAARRREPDTMGGER